MLRQLEARTHRIWRMSLALLFVFLAFRSATAEDFLRGDANNDGVVSLADAYSILNYLFHFGELTCGTAADANDSGGRVDISDAAYIEAYVLGESGPPPAPFPDVGPDPTPDGAQLPAGCTSYGGGSVLEDSSSRMEIIDAAADGGKDGSAHILIALSSSVHVTAFWGSLAFPPGLITSVEKGGENDVLPGTYFGPQLAGDRLSFLVEGTIKQPADIAPSPLTAALDLRVCLAQGTPQGDYPISFERGEFVEAVTSRSVQPTLGSLSLTVFSDVTASESCTDPPPPPPPPLNASYELVGGTAPPGQTVDLTFKIKADAEVQGFSASIDFDEEVLEALSAERLWQKPDGSDYSFYRYEYSNDNKAPGNGGIDEGFLILVAVIDFTRPIGLPIGENEVVRFHMRVRPETTAASTELRFMNGAVGTGQPVPNRLTANGNTEYTEDSAESFVFINGLIGIAPDIITFIRGDSNGDEKVDLSDAQTTLSALFLGTGHIACFDAADANDDGVLGISDPIFTLSFLYLGGRSLPPPYPAAGEDPTPDAMGCLYKEP